MNITYEAKPFMSTRTKLTYMILGAILLVAVMMMANMALAGPKECPPGQRGDCSTYKHSVTGNKGCYPNKANLGANWVLLFKGCEDNNPQPPQPEPQQPQPIPVIVTQIAPPSPVETDVPARRMIREIRRTEVPSLRLPVRLGHPINSLAQTVCVTSQRLCPYRTTYTRQRSTCTLRR
jgi:hypothetical protein